MLTPLCPRSGEGGDRGGFLSARRQSGFNLIELMVVVIVVAILAAIAYPLYTNYVDKSRRSAAVTALQHAASLEEKYFAIYNTYATLDQIGYASASATVPSAQEAWYTLSASGISTTRYTLTATPIPTGPQADDACGIFSLSSTGQKGVGPGASVSECWGG